MGGTTARYKECLAFARRRRRRLRPPRNTHTHVTLPPTQRTPPLTAPPAPAPAPALPSHPPTADLPSLSSAQRGSAQVSGKQEGSCARLAPCTCPTHSCTYSQKVYSAYVLVGRERLGEGRRNRSGVPFILSFFTHCVKGFWSFHMNEW